MTGVWGVSNDLFLGGFLSLSGCAGGLCVLIGAAAARPNLLERAVWSVAVWGCLSSMFTFVWIFLLPPPAFELLLIGPLPAIGVFTWMFVRHVQRKHSDNRMRDRMSPAVKAGNKENSIEYAQPGVERDVGPAARRP